MTQSKTTKTVIAYHISKTKLEGRKTYPQGRPGVTLYVREREDEEKSNTKR